jgi:hypothetical protein
MKAMALAGSVLAAVFAVAGCSDTTEQRAREAGQQAAEAARAAGKTLESAAQDAVENAERARDSAVAATGDAQPDAGDGVRSRTEDAEAVLRQAGRTARAAADEAADVAAAAAQTAKVKTALLADANVEAAGIDVDTDAATNVIALKGHVPSAAQKSAAGRIAAAQASVGYKVSNELSVNK